MNLSFCILLCQALASAKLSPSSVSSGQPNIVWLISEDNSVHYSKLYVETGAEMPKLDTLAIDGVIFNHAFSVAPVCSVARSALATGCYPARLGMQFHRKQEPVTLPDGVRPVFELLHDAGYHTSFWKKNDFNFGARMGKWDSRKDWSGRKPGQPFFHKHLFAMTHEGQLQQRNMKGKDAEESVMPHHPDTPLFRQANHAYKKLNTQMDAEVGAVVERLRKEGLLEDTFIFYFGDHGGVLPGSKGYLYETGLHVPLVVRIPENFRDRVNLEPGTRSDGFIEFVDIGPTTLHLAGLPLPGGMDGKPFLGPGVSREELESRRETLGLADRFDEKYDLVRSLRRGKLKYIRNYQPFNFHGLNNIYRYKMAAYREWRDLYRAGKLNELQSRFFKTRPPEELYDVENDPYETVNLAADPAYEDALVAMRTRLRERLKALPDLGFLPERDLMNGALQAPVAWGEANRARIGRLIDIADLTLLPFAEARPGIDRALSSPAPLERYWGCIASSVFLGEAAEFSDRAKALAASDSDLLVRARAAEFLALAGLQDPQDVLMDVLSMSESEMETTQVLNILTLLKDGTPGYPFDLEPEDVHTRGYFVDRCLVYLCGIPRPKRSAYTP